MNIFNKKFTVAPWVRQLLVSITGTSIGVGLSFAVNRMVESHKQQKAQRETAFMAVYDISEINRLIKEETEWEDSLFNVTMYVSTHQDEIGTMSEDTLHMVIDYLLYDPSAMKEWFVDTRENAFNNSMEARRNLGNIQFYDNVQSCYQVRRQLIKYMENAPAFQRPLSLEEYDQFLLQLGPDEIDYGAQFPIGDAATKLIEKVLKKKSVTLYLKRYFQRLEAYHYTTYKLEQLNRENKYLMNISDQDMDVYVRRNVDRSQPATAALIEGTWEYNIDVNQATYEFHPDSTSRTVYKSVNKMSLILKEEKMEVLITIPFTMDIKGKWELQGDSLKMEYDNETIKFLSFEIDLSNLPKAALERVKDSLEIQKKHMQDYCLQMFKAKDYNFTRKITLDISGNVMLWTSGGKNAETEQLFRKEE